jgi:hypothetical protein
MPELVEVSPGHFVSCYLFDGAGEPSGVTRAT